jgi:demethoxyubiquinone hydroxylase (CLK1/Coq7/Cat5 family)
MVRRPHKKQLQTVNITEIKMPSSGMLRSLAPIRTDISEERVASIIRVTRIGELGTLAVTSNRSTLRRNTMRVTVFLRSILRLLVIANVVPTSPIPVTLMMEAICFSLS